MAKSSRRMLAIIQKNLPIIRANPCNQAVPILASRRSRGGTETHHHLHSGAFIILAGKPERYNTVYAIDIDSEESRLEAFSFSGRSDGRRLIGGTSETHSTHGWIMVDDKRFLSNDELLGRIYAGVRAHLQLIRRTPPEERTKRIPAHVDQSLMHLNIILGRGFDKAKPEASPQPKFE